MDFQFKGKIVFFATNNMNKFDEARRILAKYKIALGMIRVKTFEIQSDSLEEIAKTSVIEAFKNCGLPVFVEDAGLFIEALNGFPGPYAAYVYKTIGNRGVLRFMEKVENRKASFNSVVAYRSMDCKYPICFRGQVLGEIVKEERREKENSGFGFDPIFEPKNSKKTFAEMSLLEKNKCSHRANALHKFAKWYKKLQ